MCNLKTTSRKLCGDKDCKNCFKRSFASHEKSRYLIKEDGINPLTISIQSHKRLSFRCPSCKHTFDAFCYNITKPEGTFCPYCTNKKICDIKDCNHCNKRSFKNNEKHVLWDYDKNSLEPWQVINGSRKKYWLLCNKCHHSYEIRLDRVEHSGCPYCSCRKICPNYNCKLCFDKSVASQEYSKFWDYEKNEDTPNDIMIGSEQKRWFFCNNCNKSFDIRLYSIRHSWCPTCNKKTERILNKWLCDNYKNVEYQKTFEWCKNKLKLPFDFYIDDMKIVIEVDGLQHFVQVSNWTSPEITIEKDLYKMKKLKENGISIIRIKQQDIYKNKINWKYILKENIRDYKEPQTIFIEGGADNDYHKYKL